MKKNREDWIDESKRPGRYPDVRSKIYGQFHLVIPSYCRLYNRSHTRDTQYILSKIVENSRSSSEMMSGECPTGDPLVVTNL